MAEENKQKLSFDELMSQVTDPSLLHAMAAKFGLKIGDPAGKEVREPIKKKEKPVLEIPEDASPAQMGKLVAQYTEKLSAYFEDQVASKTDSVRNEVKQKEEDAFRKKVNEFDAKNKDFRELLPIIDPLVASGRYTLEDAYEIAKKTKPQEPSSSTQGKAEGKKEAPKVASFKTGEAGETPPDDLKPQFKTVREAAKANLENMLAEDPNALKDDSATDEE